MAVFAGSLIGTPLPLSQAPWSTPSVIAPCHAWQIWRPSKWQVSQSCTSGEGVTGHVERRVPAEERQQEVVEPAALSPFSPHQLLRLKDPVGERAGEALCKNGGGQELCGLGPGCAVSKPHLYQHAWTVRGPLDRLGRRGSQHSLEWICCWNGVD